VLHIARTIPTYYLAVEIINAFRNLGSAGSDLLDIGILMGTTILFLVISARALCR
jgi:hypothetical protein